MQAQVLKWGNSLAVRIPKPIADEAHFQVGDPLEIGERYVKCRCFRACVPPVAVSTGRGAGLAVRVCALGISSSATA